MSNHRSLALLVTVASGCGSAPPNGAASPPAVVIAPVSEETSRAEGEAEPAKQPGPLAPALALTDIAGVYESQIWSQDEMRPGHTEFRAPSGNQAGEYTFEQDGTVYAGRLLDCEWQTRVDSSGSTSPVLSCSWQDDFGTGKAAFLFDEARRGFSGWWLEGDEGEPHPWIGLREGP